MQMPQDSQTSQTLRMQLYRMPVNEHREGTLRAHVAIKRYILPLQSKLRRSSRDGASVPPVNTHHLQMAAALPSATRRL